MLELNVTLRVDEHADPPQTAVHVDAGTGDPVGGPTDVTRFLAAVDAVGAAAGRDLRADLQPTLQAALELLHQRIGETDEQQAARRAAEQALAPVVQEPKP